MINIKNRDNLTFEGMDPWETHVPKRKLQLLKNSWAEVFRNHVLSQLPVNRLMKHFSKTMGRPTKELTAMAGACVLQQFFDLTDEETRNQLAFNQQWHYALDILDNDDPDYFGNARPSDSQKRLEDIAPDLYELIEQFKDNEQIQTMYTYKLLKRVFDEQCSVDNDLVTVKPAKQIRSDSLQNPSDVDATYDGHKGQGYQVQIMETYSKDDADESSSQQSLQLITHVNVEPAHCHDSDAVEPALNDTKERNLLPEELDADTLYGSTENVEKAKALNVNLVAPVPGKKPDNNLTSCSFDDNTHEIQSCPQGHSPSRIKRNKKGSISCIWDHNICENCPLRSECIVKQSKKGYIIRYRPKEMELALRRQYEQSDDFKNKYRYRSGIEASISRYIHMTGARRLRYRGLNRVSFAAQIKAIGINVFRTTRYLRDNQNQACFA